MTLPLDFLLRRMFLERPLGLVAMTTPSAYQLGPRWISRRLTLRRFRASRIAGETI